MFLIWWQPYTINGAKVIFLNQRPQSRTCKQGSANICLTCDRILQEPFHFCSLSCKVHFISSCLSTLSVSHYPIACLNEGLLLIFWHTSQYFSTSFAILEAPLLFGLKIKERKKSHSICTYSVYVEDKNCVLMLILLVFFLCTSDFQTLLLESLLPN